MRTSIWHMVHLQALGAGTVPGRDKSRMQAELLAGLRVVNKWVVVKTKDWEFGQAAGRQRRDHRSKTKAMGKPGHTEAERVSWETKKNHPKKWEEIQASMISSDALQSQNPQR